MLMISRWFFKILIVGILEGYVYMKAYNTKVVPIKCKNKQK